MIDYFEKRALNYAERSERGLWGRFRRREWEAVSTLVEGKSGQRLLELGCGAGFYSRRFHEMGLQVVAVDNSPAMLSTLEYSGIPTVLSKAEDFHSPPLFDRALAAGLLEFVPDAGAVFARARAALKPQGRFVTLIPAAGLPGHIYRSAHEWRQCPVHLRTLEEYLEIGRKAGFVPWRVLRPTSISYALEFLV